MNEENNNNFEEVQLSNIWIKTHILDVIGEINELQTIARIGSLDIGSLSQMDNNEKIKMRLNALDLFEARLDVLKGNVFFGIDPKQKLKILLLLKQQADILAVCEYKQYDSLNEEAYTLNENFNKKLNILQKIKESLIDACAEKGMLLPKVDDELDEKTQDSLEDDEDE